MSNDTTRGLGRLGNHIIRNGVCSALAEKYHLAFKYGYAEQIERLGISLYKEGTRFYDRGVEICEGNGDFFRYLNHDDLGENNLIVGDRWLFFQTKEIAHYLKCHFASDVVKQRIMDHNMHAHRYNNNDDIFVHVRLDDASACCPNFEWFDRVIGSLSFTRGYISSDTITHDTCKRLIAKYNLQEIVKDEVETIMLASTCKYVVLSTGTFGWFIGTISWFSHVFYPNLRALRSHHPVEIYDFSDWNMVDIA